MAKQSDDKQTLELPGFDQVKRRGRPPKPEGALTPAQKQAAYRARKKAAGFVQVEMTLDQAQAIRLCLAQKRNIQGKQSSRLEYQALIDLFSPVLGDDPN